MARNNRANEEMMKYAFIALGVILFLPFMLFSYLHYSSIKKRHIKGSCTQRVYDVGLLWRSIIQLRHYHHWPYCHVLHQ